MFFSLFEATQVDSSFTMIVSLCRALCHHPVLSIASYSFFPTEFILQALEADFVSFMKPLLRLDYRNVKHVVAAEKIFLNVSILIDAKVRKLAKQSVLRPVDMELKRSPLFHFNFERFTSYGTKIGANKGINISSM